MDPMGKVGRIYKEDHYTWYTKKLATHKSSVPCGFGEHFLCFSHCKSMGANDHWAGAFLKPGAWLAGFLKRTTTHCCIQNMKALRLVVSVKMFFFF